jgi:DNA-binding GntR family transcriptional regulator
VIIGSNRRAAVVCFNDEEISQIGAVRLAQDILSAQLASYYGSAADFDKLEQFAADCEEASTKGDVYGRIRIDADFHLAIAKISGNDRLIALQYATYQQIHLIQVAKYTDIEHSLIQIHHHMPLVSAIRNGELGEARNLICEHIKDFYRIDPYILKCYCDN